MARHGTEPPKGVPAAWSAVTRFDENKDTACLLTP